MKTIQFCSFNLLLAGFAFCFLQACEPKEETDPTPTDPPVNADTIVLKPGKGFSSLTIVPSTFDGSTGANGGFADGIAPVDLSLLPDGKTLYFSSLSSIQTQQNPLMALSFYSMDTDNRVLKAETVPTLKPSTANNAMEPWTYMSSDQAFKNRTTGYLEGTGLFFQGGLTYNSFGVGTAFMGGNISYSRTNTFAQMPRATAGGQVVEGVFAEILVRIDGKRNNRVFGAYRKADNTIIPLDMSNIAPTREVCIAGGEVEPKAINSNDLWFFWASFTHLYVSEIDTQTVSGLTPAVKVDSLPLPAGFSAGFNDGYHPYSFITRRSDDGQSFGILLRNSATDSRFVSASFSPVTRKLTQNLNNLSIPGGLGGTTNFDIDPQGNVYFDGWANNFQSDSTISIYKASGSGITSIGEDVIKSGSIKQIRFMGGKVFAAVVYSFRKNLTSANATRYYRIAIIRQD